MRIQQKNGLHATLIAYIVCVHLFFATNGKTKGWGQYMIGLNQNISANILSDPHYFLDWPDCEKKKQSKIYSVLREGEKSNIYKTKIF